MSIGEQQDDRCKECGIPHEYCKCGEDGTFGGECVEDLG